MQLVDIQTICYFLNKLIFGRHLSFPYSSISPRATQIATPTSLLRLLALRYLFGGAVIA
jgi:hypothetical protein